MVFWIRQLISCGRWRFRRCMKRLSFTEHDLIRYLTTTAGCRTDVSLGIGDDCALLCPPPNQVLAVTTDTLVAGIHFPLTTSPSDIGYKSLAVSLSDLAAM